MRIRVEGQAVLVYEPGRLVSKSVEQYVAEVEFTDEWQGFSKFMVFATKDETVMIEQAVRDDQLTMVVPWEVLEEDGMIKVGFYGLDGTGRRPTIWSKPLLVLHGVGPGEPTREPTITPWEQMVAWIGNIADLKTEEKENLVAAVNEIYDLGGVKSVNGQIGVVVLSADDVGALPDTTHIPDKTSDLTNDSGYITEADIPEVPVKSVNSKTGNVVLDAGDVHALPDSTVVPTKTSQLQNDSGFVKRSEIPASAVTSVNSKTGDVVLNASDVHALSENTRIPTKTSDLTNDKGFITLQEVPAAPVRSVNNKTGNVYLDAEDVGALPDDTEIPTELSQLGDDSTHRLVTDAEKTSWNAKADESDLAEHVENDVIHVTQQDRDTWDSKVTSVNGETGVVELDVVDRFSCQKIKPFLYEATAIQVDYDYAYDFFLTRNPNVPASGCSAVRIGNEYGRNFDWQYNNQSSFALHVPACDGRYASVGIAGSVPGVLDTNEGAWDKKIIPFFTQDGINEYGLTVSTLVVPSEGQENRSVPTGTKRNSVNGIMLCRYMLDRYKTVDEAIADLTAHVEIWFSDSLHDMNYEQHWLIADAEDTYAIEVVNNAIVAREIDALTNFLVNGVTLNADGTVYTPATLAHGSPTTDNGITAHGSGLERWNIIAQHTTGTMRELLTSLKYTNAYQQDTGWHTEFVGGGLHCDSQVSAFAAAEAEARTAYQSRTRDNPVTWQTVHGAIYNIAERSLTVVVQEDGVEIAVGLDAISERVADLEDTVATQSDKIDAKLDAPETAGQAGQVLGLDSDLNKVWMTTGGIVVEYGAGLKLTGNVLSVDTASVVQQDNTRPVTSAAVFNEVGNINALLATI